MRFVVRRLGSSLLVLALSSVLIFVALRVIPGDPTSASQDVTPSLSSEEIAQVRRELGLDRSIPAQYVIWLKNAALGDLGRSYYSGFATTDLIRSRLLATLELTFAALIVALMVALPVGILAALRPRSLLDRSVGAGASAGIATPPYWLGVLLASLFGVQLGWLPARGYVPFGESIGENMRLTVLPAATLAILMAAPIVRYLRLNMLEVLGSDFIRTAEGKGLPRSRVVLRHALPNAMIPTLNVIGVIVGLALGGVVYIEYVFGWPGIGALAVDSVAKRDYIVLQSVVLLAVVVFIFTSLIVDIITYAIDPRLRRAAI